MPVPFPFLGLVAFLVAAVTAPPAALVARRLGLVDHPGPMKPQTDAVPFLGGVAVLGGMVPVLAMSDPRPLIVLGAAFLLGLADDVRPSSPIVRLVAEVVIGLGVLWIVPVRGPIAAVAVVGITATLINGMNFLDGLDGLAGGVALAAAVGFAALAGDPVLALALAGGVGGFLLHNRPPARIYLGDAGSYLIGAALAILLVRTWTPGASVGLLAVGVLLVGVPLAEIATDVLRRIYTRVPLFVHERAHVYDQLVARGWGRGAVVLAFVATQAFLSLCAIVASRLGVGAFLVAAGAAAVYVSLVAAGGFLSSVGPRQRHE
jgi:UDP-GlcNAc:undecaprenyl-phosphate GlcNAc-1-phosphate transferase